jgi:hypothetical protein
VRDATLKFSNNGINYRLIQRTISRREHEDLGNHIKPEPLSKRERRKSSLLKGHYKENES